MKRQELIEYLNSDIYRLEGNTKLLSKIKNTIIHPGYRFMVIHRKCNYYRKKNRIIFWLYRLRLINYNFKYGFQISNAATIGKGMYIGHRGGIVINPHAVIGDNFSITSGVTIGAENRGARKGVPTIGNMVWIGANSTLVGNIKIGNNVLVAPNTFINFDVPDDSIVIGSPGVIKRRTDATSGYITWIYGEV